MLAFQQVDQLNFAMKAMINLSMLLKIANYCYRRGPAKMCRLVFLEWQPDCSCLFCFGLGRILGDWLLCVDQRFIKFWHGGRINLLKVEPQWVVRIQKGRKIVREEALLEFFPPKVRVYTWE